MSRQARIGLLVLAGALLFLVGLFTIANRSFLLSEAFYVRSQFNRVAGLQVGSEVQYQGINVGRVESVQLPAAPGGKITVTMAITQKARHLVRRNTQAQIKSDGLVGNQIVVLVPSAELSDPIESNEAIQGIDPFDLFEITDRMLASVQSFETAAVTFDQIMQDVRQGEGTLGKVLYDPSLYNGLVATTDETRRVLANLADNAEAFVGLAGDATQGVQSILQKLDEGEGTLPRLINDPAVFNTLLNTADTLQAIAGDMRAITVSAENTANWGALGAYRFAELMEAAKHNWLFKRYFEERGYMQAAPFEVRERALEATLKQMTAREHELQAWEERLKAREAALQTSSQDTGAPGGQ
jgi:phospholipid/cholesterol/gamma-HCH transport system substrate-binding protein